MDSRRYTRFFASDGNFDTFGSGTFAIQTDRGIEIHTEVPATEEVMKRVLGRTVVGDPTEEIKQSVALARLQYLETVHRGKTILEVLDDLPEYVLSDYDQYAIHLYREYVAAV